MWIYLLQGIGFGFAAAVQPGPFQTYLISQTLTRGWKHTLPAALAPLVSDGPIITVALLLLSQVPNWMQRSLYITGGLFILFLAYGAYKAWKTFDPMLPSAGSQQSIWKGALMIMISPGPYVYWSLVTGPVLLKGWRETPVHGLVFLAGFYITVITALVIIIFVFGTAQKLGPRMNRMLLGLSVLALFGFGLYELWQGLV